MKYGNYFSSLDTTFSYAWASSDGSCLVKPVSSQVVGWSELRRAAAGTDVALAGGRCTSCSKVHQNTSGDASLSTQPLLFFSALNAFGTPLLIVFDRIIKHLKSREGTLWVPTSR